MFVKLRLRLGWGKGCPCPPSTSIFWLTFKVYWHRHGRQTTDIIDNIDLVYLFSIKFSGSNLGLVWLTRRVPSLECKKETESHDYKWGWSLRRSSSGIVWPIHINITNTVWTKHSGLRCIWHWNLWVLCLNLRVVLEKNIQNAYHIKFANDL